MIFLLISLIHLSFVFTYISSDATGLNGVVVSSKIQATQIGVDILKRGGNAIDAAVAVTESEGIGSNDYDTTFPTSAAVKDYVDTNVTAQDLDISGDSYFVIYDSL